MRLKDKAKRRDRNWYRNIKMQIKNRELAEDFKEVFLSEENGSIIILPYKRRINIQTT